MPSKVSPRARSRWAGVDPAARRAERRALLLDTAFDLLGTQGSSATTVRSVCAAARLNPRYFYESFASLDELLVAVYDRVVGELGISVRTALEDADADAAAQTRAAVERIVAFVDEDRRRGRVLYMEALDNEALNRRRLETGHRLVEAIATDAAARTGAPESRIGRVAAALLVGGFTEVLVAWLDGRIDANREELVGDATVLLAALQEAVVSGARYGDHRRGARPGKPAGGDGR